MEEPHTAGRARLTLVLGGARSGKSRHAQILAMATPPPWVYIATAQALDDEMSARIAKHKADRGNGWSTIEEPIELARAVAEAQPQAPLVIDCITFWLSNLMLGAHDVDSAVARFVRSLDERKAPTFVVSCEVGGGLVPETPLGRAFRDEAGLVNQQLAVSAHHCPAHGGRARHATEGAAMTENVKQDEQERHRAKMANRKAAQDAEVAAKTIPEKGLLIVHTGTGKGKSTAAFGLVLRMVGNGGKCAVVQFIKGAWNTGERSVLEGFGDMVRWHTLGEGFTWETQDKTRDMAAAAKAWETAKALMQDPDLKLIVLDEINIALRYDYLPLAEVVETLKARRPDLHVVVTGRNAKREMIEAADLVTEMTLVKHHFAAGVKAQAGIEY